MAERTALIVGAGIGGFAACVALRRAGWAVRILDPVQSLRRYDSLRARRTRSLVNAADASPDLR